MIPKMKEKLIIKINGGQLGVDSGINLYNNPSIMDNPDKLKLHKKKQDYPYTPSESSNKDKVSKKEKEEDKNIIKELTMDEIIEIIRDNIKSKVIRCRIALENNFRSFDGDNS